MTKVVVRQFLDSSVLASGFQCLQAFLNL
jgi:hypothetical protein